MAHIGLAILILCSIYFSMGGALWATNFIIFLLVMNVVLVVYSVTVYVGFQKTLLVNAEKRLEQLEEFNKKVDMRILIALRVFLLLCVWHIYMLGYALFAGIALTTVTISLITMICRVLDMKVEVEEEE